jgi:predicted DNA binding protein
MIRAISVECWADKYFIWKLLQDERIVNKEENKENVIKYIAEKGKTDFCIGIIDRDNKNFNKYLERNLKRSKKTIGIDYELKIGNWLDVIKINNSNGFLIQFGPIKFENWIADYLIERGKKFDWFNSIIDLEKCCKGRLSEIIKNERFIKLMKFVLTDFKLDNKNRVFVLKEILLLMLANGLVLTQNMIENKIKELGV